MNASQPLAPAQQLSLPVEGMHCASCVGRVESALAKVPGVKQVAVNLATERADIELNETIDPTALVNAVKKIGFDVPLKNIELAIDGMHCASCVGRVERTLKAVPGVTDAAVNLATERASVDGVADVDALIAAIQKTGFGARSLDHAGPDHSSETASKKDVEQAELKRDLILALQPRSWLPTRSSSRADYLFTR